MALREFSSVSVGDLLPEKTFQLTRQDLVNYAGVSGDLNPIHWDDETAKLVGLPDGAIAHGMLTMGLGGGYVTDWVGDPAAITEYNVRFTSFVTVPNGEGAQLVFTGRVKSVDPESKSVTVALTATHEGKKIFGRAIASAKLA